MTNSQYKKHQAYLFNMERAERLAYEMDRVLFPPPQTRHRERMTVRSNRISKQAILCGIALASSMVVSND
jgi:hypothetical protein